MAIIAKLRRIVSADIHKFGVIQVDVGRAQVSRNGKPVFLRNLEYRLLRHFIKRAGRSLSRDELLRVVWGYEGGTSTRTVDVHINHLRQKLEQDAKRPALIVTVPGVGYKLVASG